MDTSFYHWFYLVFISLRCLEPVELSKNLAQNQKILFLHVFFEHQILDFLKTRLLLVLKFIYKNKYLPGL